MKKNIFVYYGDEPYYILRAKQRLFQSVEFPDINISSYEEFDEAAYEAAITYPIMEEKRVVYLDLDKVSQLNTPWWKKYCSAPVESTIIFAYARTVDLRTKFSQDLKKLGYLILCDKIDESSLKKEVISFIKDSGGTISQEALEELIRRENYTENDGVNLISVTEDIKSMLGINKDIGVDMVLKYVRDNAKDNVFALAKLILGKRAKELYREISLISSDQAIPTLALLLREYRIAYKAMYFTPGNIGVKYIAFKPMPKKQLLRGMEICTSALEDIKTGRLDAGIALQLVAGRLISL